MQGRKRSSAFLLAMGVVCLQACSAHEAATGERGRDAVNSDVPIADVPAPAPAGDPGAEPGTDPGTDPGPEPPPGSAPPPAPSCSIHVVSPDDMNTAEPGDVVCFEAGAKRSRLKITKGGTPEKPIIYSGEGTDVDGIDVEANNVVVQNYKMTKPKAPGIWAEGNNITLQNNTITKPVDGDGDGIRFFGKNIKILKNTISGTSNQYGHADCMQTYASDTPPSEDILIEGNRCEKIDNMCLMAEGPNDGEGDGEGHSHHFTLRNNFCETLKASQAIMMEDIQYATITDNEFAAAPTKAIGLDIGSTYATVSGNKVSPDIEYEVGMDSSSKKGYKGPKPGGPP